MWHLGVELSSGCTVLNDGLPLPAVCKLVAVVRVGHNAGKITRAQSWHESGSGSCRHFVILTCGQLKTLTPTIAKATLAALRIKYIFIRKTVKLLESLISELLKIILGNVDEDDLLFLWQQTSPLFGHVLWLGSISSRPFCSDPKIGLRIDLDLGGSATQRCLGTHSYPRLEISEQLFFDLNSSSWRWPGSSRRGGSPPTTRSWM